MNDAPPRSEAPPEWLEVLAESEADLAAGRTVPGDVVIRDLRDALARLEAKAEAKGSARRRASRP